MVSRELQDLWLEFAKDPHNGLRNVGWSSYVEDKAMLFGHTDTLVRQIDISELNSVCTIQ